MNGKIEIAEPDKKANQYVVDMLRMLLEEAEADKLVTVLVVTVNTERDMSWHEAGLVKPHQIIGQLELLKHKIAAEAMPEMKDYT